MSGLKTAGAIDLFRAASEEMRNAWPRGVSSGGLSNRDTAYRSGRGVNGGMVNL